MEQYIGLDVSLKDTAISIRQGGSRIWRGKCASDPTLLAEIIRKQAPTAKRVVFETGPLSTWFYHALTAEGVPAICIEARHAQKILNETLNKTDANDADGLAQLAEAGFYKTVRVKSFEAMLDRTLIGVRKQVAGMSIQLSNQIRGVMKTFGLIVPKSKGRVFEGHVRELLAGNDSLARIILPLLDAWRDIRKHAANLDRQLLAAARNSRAAQLLMTIPGIGAITSLSFSAAIEDPGNFKRSRSVGAWLGLTTRRYQSGEIDYDGHISRRGDTVDIPDRDCAPLMLDARFRAHVKHVFAHQKNRFGLFIRTIGLARAEAKLTLCNLAYNFNRLIFHERRESMG